MALENPQVEKILVNAKATYYRDFVRVFIPNQPYIHLPKGITATKKQAISTRIDSDEDSVLYETNLERSIRRTRKTIRDYVFMNDFEWFATFTFGKDRYDDDRSRAKLATWLRNQRKRNGRFHYIIVAERHKDGALHFHGLIGGYDGKLKYAINPHTGKRIPDGHGDFVRNFAEYKLGNNSAKKISDGPRTVRYIQKYITKENITTFGKNRYWASKNLKRPTVEENPEPFYKFFDEDRHYVTDHGTVLEFDKNKNPIIDAFIESHWSDNSQ